MRFLIKILLALTLVFPASVSQINAMELQTFWLCVQPGVLDNQIQVFYISDVSESGWTNYKQREEEFGRAIKRMLGKKMEASYEPYCLDFRSQEDAQNSQKDLIKKATQHGFIPFLLKFVYKQDAQSNVQKQEK